MHKVLKMALDLRPKAKRAVEAYRGDGLAEPTLALLNEMLKPYDEEQAAKAAEEAAAADNTGDDGDGSNDGGQEGGGDNEE